MICEKCGKRQATTHIKKMVNGVYEEHHYCSECAQQSGITGDMFPSLSGFAKGGLFGSLIGLPFGEPTQTSHGDTQRCPSCGISFAEISTSGKVGCAKCYDTFRSRLLPSVERIHGKASHAGKIPHKDETPEDRRKKEIAELKEKLNKAVESQEYEQAAKYRDEIKNLEGEK